MTSTDPSPTPARPPGLIRRTFRRHRLGILAAWLVGSIAACGLAIVYVKPVYRAFTLIRVEPTVTDLYNVRGGKDDDLEPFIQTQVQLISSPNVLTAAGTNPKAAVLERIQKAGDVVQELQQAVRASVRPNTYLIEVEMTSANGYEAATIVNAVVDAYMDANNEWSDGMTRQQIKNLEAYQGDLKSQSDDLDRKWKTLAAKSNLDLPAQGEGKEVLSHRASITIEEYRQVRQELNAVEMNLAEAQAWLTAAKANVRVVDPELLDRMVKRRFQFDPDVANLLGKIKEAETRLSEAKRTSALPDDPAVVASKRKLDGLASEYNQMWEEKSKALREQIAIGDDAQALEREVREADTAVKKLLARQKMLEEKHEKLDVKGKDMASDAVEIALIQDGRHTLKEMQDAVTRRLEQIKYEAKEVRIRPVNPNGAMVPTRPISDKRGLVLGLIPLVMLFGVVGLFVGVEAWSGPGPAKDKSGPMREV